MNTRTCEGLKWMLPVLFDVSAEVHVKKEDTVVLKLGSLTVAPQAENPLSRTVLRKDIYQ